PTRARSFFLTSLGEGFAPSRMTQLVRGYVRAADLGKSGSCHPFRHTMATLMLEGGADVRYIQEMLGHVDLSTTQIYTQVSIRKLKQVHELTHPGAKLHRTIAKSTRRNEAEPDSQSTAGDSAKSELFDRLQLESVADDAG